MNFKAIIVFIVATVICIVLAIICSQTVNAVEKQMTRKSESKSSVVRRTEMDGGYALRTVSHDEHMWVVGDALHFAIHHPDCPCHAK